MNYLAHIFLSNKDPKIMVGNFLGDLINNKEYQRLPADLQKGVELHRKIDSYTDNHDTVEKGVSLLHPYHHKYAPVVVDIFYDYLLFHNWEKYSDEKIQDFSDWAYGIILEHLDAVPQRNKEKVKTLVEHNWLLGYGELEQLHQTFLRVKKRAKFPNQFEFATEHLENHFDALNEGFNQFLPELIRMTEDFMVDQVD